MKKLDWKKYIYKVVVVILIIFFVGGVGMGAADILSIEGTRELYTPDEAKSEFPDTDEKLVAYINSVVQKSLKENPKVDMNESFSVDSDSFKNSIDSSSLTACAKKVSGEVEGKAEELFESKNADFGKSAASFLAVPEISISDVEKIDFNYQYYKCSMCTSEIAFADYSKECPECGSPDTLELRYSDNYEITVHIKPGSASFKNECFPKSEFLEGIISDAGGEFYGLESFKKSDEGAVLYVKANRLTDQIYEMSFETDSLVTAGLSFKGPYSDLGKADLSFNSNEKISYSFTWPGLSLDASEKTVELGSSEVLKATLSCDEPTDYTVKWSSDNEDILTVDEEGYLKTHKKFGDATIKAEFTFNGITYSDECLIHVGVPAEGVDLSKGKLSLKQGDEFTLKAEFDPKDTTNTVCYWYSEDENVAKIDKNGKVTAVSKGQTTVYVITDDGNYYSSCSVEVTG